MTEHEARDWIDAQFGPVGVDRLTIFADAVMAENGRQNLIAPSTVATIWTRHLLDSAQLACWDRQQNGPWLDVGTGGGFPGLVLALLLDRPFLLCEPRRRRAEFLSTLVDSFALGPRVRIAQTRVERLAERVDTVTARAVSSVAALLTAGKQCAHRDTLWILPRGQSGADELRSLPMHQANLFHVEHSLTDPAAVILVGRGLA